MENKEIHPKHYGTGDIILGDRHEHHHQAPHIIPRVLTKQVGLANDIDFVGRKNELQKVDELLNQNAMLLLLNGIGGIGKSTLASYYLNQKKDEFDYYGFVQVNEDIKLSLASAFSTSLDLKSEKIDDLFAEIMSKLNNLDKNKKKLLIIDDVKEMDNQKDEINTLMTLKNNGFQILFTSREVKDNIKNYPLPMMNEGDARDLFLKHYDTDDINNIDIIVKEYLDYHPLFIEMTAKTLSLKRRLSLNEIIKKFESEEYQVVKRDDIESYHKFLDNFSMNDQVLQNEETLLFIKKLALLPSIEISFEELYKFLVCDNKDNKDKLDNFLIKLIRNGWLIEFKDGYKFHQILRDYILERYKPKFEEIEKQIDYCIYLTKDSSDPQKALDNRDNLIYFKSILAFIEKEEIKNQKTATIYNNFGLTFNYLNEPDEKIIRLYEKSLKIREKIENKNTAETLNNLAGIYSFLKNYREAQLFHFKALKIRKKCKLENEIGSSYNNLGVLLYRKKEYHKSKLFWCKSIQIWEGLRGKLNKDSKELPNLNSLLAKAHDNLGVLYKVTEEVSSVEIIKLHEKALNLRIESLSEWHIDKASSYKKLSDLYFEEKNFEKSFEFIQEYIKIYEENFLKSGSKLVEVKDSFKKSVLNLFHQYQDKNISIGIVDESFNIDREDVLALFKKHDINSVDSELEEFNK